MKYRCPHCNKTVERESDKHWIGSYCSEKGIKTRIMKVDKLKKI
jgi:ribosomal protein L37AE/L43A